MSLPVQRPTEAPALVVLAAGMGTRFGGLKQFEPMGPNGETLLDYSVFDAMRSGFGRVVFVLRSGWQGDLQRQLQTRYGDHVPLSFAYQDLQDLPEGFALPSGRTRPWGTAHALRAARGHCGDRFAVINADDFYGHEAYRSMARHLQSDGPSDQRPYAMVGYPLHTTLSATGGVNRGICVAHDGLLTSVQELTDIGERGDGRCHGKNALGDDIVVPRDALVSMNLWGFDHTVIAHIDTAFCTFVQQHGNDPAAECFLPDVVDTLIGTGQAQCQLLPTDAPWFGVTYRQDKQICAARLRALVDSGAYPSPLWSVSHF